MRRLVLVPLVTAPIAGAAAVVWITGLAWPIVTTFARCLAKPEPCNEADLIG